MAQESAHDSQSGKIVVTSRLVNPHPVVAEIKRRYAESPPRYDGLYHPLSTRERFADVAPESRSRALRLADSLFKAAEARGHAVTFAKDGEVVCVIAAGEPVRVGIHERSTRVPHVPTKAELRLRQRNPWAIIPEYDRSPMGYLTFEIQNIGGARERWSEGKRWRQEDRIDVLLDGIEEAARNLHARRLEWEEQRRAWREAEERRAEEARFRAELERQIEAWRLVRDIRAFVADMRSLTADAAEALRSGDDFDRWLEWALRYAERVDPVAVRRRLLAE